MQNKLIDFFYKICQNMIGLFLLLTTGFVAILNLLYFTTVGYLWTEIVDISRTSWFLILFAVLLFLLFLLIGKIFSDVKETYLFLFFTICYLIAGLYMVLNLSNGLRMDAYAVHEAALLMLQDDFSFLKRGEYIYQNEHQLGIVTYEYLLGQISSSVRFQYFVNLLEIIGINFAVWKIADSAFGRNHMTNMFTILFSFLFLPQFFFLAFAYGNVPGLFFLAYSVLAQQSYFRDGKIWQAILCVMCLVFAVSVKGNNIIGAIAVAIVFVLRCLREKKARYLAVAAVALFCAAMTGRGISAAYRQVSGMELSGGKPNLLYIVMGIEPHNQKTAPGWYNGYNDWVFEEAGYDREKATEIARNSLKDTIYTYKDNPDLMVSNFFRKMQSIWCDTMYECIWSGPLPDVDGLHKTELLNELYRGQNIMPYITGGMKSFMIVMFALAFLSAFFRRNQKCDCDFMYLYFIGGFLLHILWEAKGQYVYPYVFFLLPCCAKEMAVIFCFTDA